jgi:hypothetical protein
MLPFQQPVIEVENQTDITIPAGTPVFLAMRADGEGADGYAQLRDGTRVPVATPKLCDVVGCTEPAEALHARVVADSEAGRNPNDEGGS